MIFQHNNNWRKIMAGDKTQTRRVVESEHVGILSIHSPFYVAVQNHTRKTKNKDVYRVDQLYAVQPARGQKAVGRIRITAIKREDVRHISDADVIAEGFEHRLDFLSVWCSMHDKQCQFTRFNDDFDGAWAYDVADEGKGLADDLVMYSYLSERPAARYQAWALTFEVVQDG